VFGEKRETPERIRNQPILPSPFSAVRPSSRLQSTRTTKIAFTAVGWGFRSIPHYCSGRPAAGSDPATAPQGQVVYVLYIEPGDALWPVTYLSIYHGANHVSVEMRRHLLPSFVPKAGNRLRGSRSIPLPHVVSGDFQLRSPGLTMFTDGSRLDDGAAGYVVVWKNGQLGGYQNSHGLHTAGRPTARSAPPSPGRWRPRFEKTDEPGASHDLHRRTGGRPSDGWPQRSLALARSTRSRQESTSPCYGEPGRTSPPGLVVPSAQGSPRKREGRRMDKARGGGAHRPRGGMARLFGPGGGVRRRSPDPSRT